MHDKNFFKSDFLIKDLQFLDYRHLRTDPDSSQSRSFYFLIEKNFLFFEEIFLLISTFVEKKDYLRWYLKDLNQYFEDSDYQTCSFITNKEKHSIAVIAIGIIWAFNETFHGKYNFTNNPLPHDSYAVITEFIDFINMFKIWHSVCKDQTDCQPLDQKKHIKIVYKIFSILQHHKLITAEKIVFFHLKKQRINYFAKNFFNIKILKIHTKSLEYKKITTNSILMGDHYSFSWKLFIPNKNNNSILKLDNDDIIKIMSKEFTNIDFAHFKNIVELYFNLNKLSFDTIYQNYRHYLDEYKLAIKNKNLTLCANLGRKLSIYQKGIDLFEILKLNFSEEEQFFLPWNYDFRGRTYYLSDISFTFNKEFRWCMYQGYYKNLEDFKPQWHFFNTKILKKLDENLNLLTNLSIEIEAHSRWVKHTILWLLISLGEINKSKLGQEVLISSFIQEGIKMFNNFEIEFNRYDYEEQIKIMTLTKFIKEVALDAGKNVVKRRLISKDAPASVFQHLVLNFGAKDEKVLEMVNLKSEDTWYDLYSILIDKWKLTIEPELTNLQKNVLILFNRKSLKKIIMTSNYGVSYDSAEKYFKEVLLDTKSVDLEINKKYIDQSWNLVKELLQNFFKFVNQLLILEKDPNKIIEYVKNNDGNLLLVDALIDLNYFKKKKYISESQIDGKRYTKAFSEFTSEKNFQKFKTATRANYVHSLDAALVRWVILRRGVYTIHDCFLIDPANITYLVALLNEGMSNKFDNFNNEKRSKKEIFSIFVVI